MPSLYIDKSLCIQEKMKKSIYSLEHIFPQSLLDKKDRNDMHNTIRTINALNVNRSNYKYTDTITDDKFWTPLDFGNYVNHKLRLFVPNAESKGFISRAILYMSKEYDYNSHKIIDKDVLLQWFFEHPPQDEEKYHNAMVRQLQNKNNIFISSYNKKSKALIKYINDL
jgi:endonuclease I